MSYIIQWRRDTAANWTLIDPVLQDGEPGYETDTRRFKVGDGVKIWSLLSYGTSTELPTGTNTGDIIRWDDSGAGAWDVVAEPFVLDEIVLTPKASSASTVEGTVFYNSDDNSIYVATE